MLPLVSCILPTRGRQKWAFEALRYFNEQTYGNRNLVIVDDMDDPSFPGWVPRHGRDCIVSLISIRDRLSIPEKRNHAVKMADGEIICHWDSDDVSMPTRIEDQVKLLLESGKSVTGFHSLLFHDEQYDRWFKYVGNSGCNALGTSLVYLKSFWEANHFNEKMPIGEDNDFVRKAREANELITVDGGFLQYARIHPGNTSVKKPGGETIEYHPVSKESLPEGFLR